jgi:predicted nucleic acid-binding Zn ribbon protein
VEGFFFPADSAKWFAYAAFFCEFPRMNSRLRAQVIAEWRGLPETPFPQDTSKPVSEVLAKLLTKLGLQTRVREQEIISAWREVVGDFAAQHSTPVSLVEGVLYVRVLQPSMRYELENTWRREILRKLKERFPKGVRDIRFRTG